MKNNKKGSVSVSLFWFVIVVVAFISIWFAYSSLDSELAIDIDFNDEDETTGMSQELAMDQEVLGVSSFVEVIDEVSTTTLSEDKDEVENE